jgi:hypothetical protein
MHKRRNVPDHISDQEKPAVARRLNAAYAPGDYPAAKQALNGLHHELMHLNPSAARSLAEGLEETPTVHRLHVPQQLRVTLANSEGNACAQFSCGKSGRTNPNQRLHSPFAVVGIPRGGQ